MHDTQRTPLNRLNMVWSGFFNVYLTLTKAITCKLQFVDDDSDLVILVVLMVVDDRLISPFAAYHGKKPVTNFY